MRRRDKTKRDTTPPTASTLNFLLISRRVRINEIHFYGNDYLSDTRLKPALKETKERAVFSPFAILDSLIFRMPGFVLRNGPEKLPSWTTDLP
jgi:hypothetical protein